MGKRKALSGLSGFLKAVEQSQIVVTDEPESSQALPLKKRKAITSETIMFPLDTYASGNPKYDCTGLVPHYTRASEVPEHLKKYFSQRLRYFSLYDSGCLLDDEGWYSVTPELIANQIAERCRCGTIVDAFCGVGGNAIAFAQTCERVIALDTSPLRLALARHNAQIYGVADRIEFVLADYLSFARTLPPRKIDVIFLSPPWGGPGYLDGSPSTANTSEETVEEQHPEYSLQDIRPIHGTELFNLSRKITPNIAYYLPRNTSMDEVGKLDVGSEMVEVEEEWMGNKLKALTCYFGGLVTGQDHLFSASDAHS